MKKNFTALSFRLAVLTTTFLCTSYHANAQQPQIPNGGFENWNATGNRKLAGGWLLSDETGITCVTPGGQRSTDNAAGSSSLLLVTSDCDFRNPHEGFAGLYIPFSGRPDSLEFMYKHNAVSSDTPMIFMFFTSANANGTKNSIVEMRQPILGAQNTFKRMSVPIIYKSNLKPDTLSIHIASDGARYPALGNKLWIDELKFVYGRFPASVKSASGTVTKVSAYPLPAGDKLTVSYELEASDMVALQIHDMTGKTIFTESAYRENGTIVSEIDLTGVPAGMYLYSIQPKTGIRIVRKFVKQ